MKITTGFMPFMGYKTFYRIVGQETSQAPLILLHGGPGSTHNYFEVLDALADLSHRQIISYDQIGCGESYLDGHPGSCGARRRGRKSSNVSSTTST